MNGWTPAETALLELLPRMARGPKREGVFALWLMVRVAHDLLLPLPQGERTHRRRVEALSRRLSSLTVPAPLRRAIPAALAQLGEATPDAALQALSQLAAPARDAGGPEVGNAVALAVQQAREMIRMG